MFKLLLSALGSFLTGPLTTVSNDLKEAYQSKLAAENDKERLAAEERIALLEARKSVILAAQDDPWERFVRIFYAIPMIAFVWKVVLWDKLLGLGVTDDFSDNFWNVFYIILGGYFLDVTIRRFKK